MRNLSLMLRWSWRDLRSNWVKVAAIALVIALGTGAYAGLTSSANWRRISNETSFDLLAVHDLRVHLAEGSVAPAGELDRAVHSIDHPEWIGETEERYVADVLVQVDGPDGEILVPGVVIGYDLAGEGPTVDRLFNDGGRDLAPADAGADVVVVHNLFADHYGLPDQGELTVGGGMELEYVGHAMQPEYFIVAPEGQILFSEADYAVLFTSIETARRIGDGDGANELVMTLAPEADPEAAARAVEQAIGSRLGIGAEVDPITEDSAYTSLTRDVDNDQKVFNLFALLLVGGAVAGAFNLVNRLVEQQRREIGAAMALGASPNRIAVRPLLVGAQIALLGVAFGVVVGTVIGSAMRSVFLDLLPLPVWRTPFQPQVFARAAAVGFLVPFAAAAWPVWRAVRVRPVDAIRPIHLTGGSSHRRRFRRLRIPGDTFTLMPLRNLARAKRRTVTTMMAVGAVIVVLVGFLGMVDSIFGTLDDADEEILRGAEDRLVVDLDGFYPVAGPEVAAVAAAPSVGEVWAGARLGAVVSSEGGSFPLLLELTDLAGAVWTPTITAGSATDPGVVLSEAAAEDLAVGVGDEVTVRYPVRSGPDAFVLETARIPVAALHPYPLRPFAYMDLSQAATFGVEGETNLLNVIPSPGAGSADVKRDLLASGTVTAVQPLAETMANVRSQISALTEILQVVGFAAFLLALLIAFNAAGINLDERFRDHATMFAYGVPVRTALRMAMIESLIIGVVATAIGVAGGVGMIWWVTSQLLSETLPDIGISVMLKPATLLTVVVMGVAAVALAPLFTVRRMRRMNLPATLRLME